MSLEPADGDPDDVWAAKVFLGQVPPGPKGAGWLSAQPKTLEKWRALMAPLVEDMGRADFARWVRWMAGHSWLAEDPERINRVGAPWLGQEVSTWQNLPPGKQDIPQAQAKVVGRGQAKRDDGRVSNAIRDIEFIYDCLDCGAALGAPHYEFCKLLGWELIVPGDLVTAQHCDPQWVVPRAQAWKAAHPPAPPKPKAPEPPPDERPACCDPRCGARLGDAHSAACVTAKAVGLSPGAPVSAQHCDRAQVAALARAHGEEVNARGREMMREMAQKLKRDRPPRFAPAPLAVATATDDDG